MARHFSILMVDDDEERLQQVSNIVGDMGGGIEVCRDGNSGLSLAKEIAPDIILIGPGIEVDDRWGVSAEEMLGQSPEKFFPFLKENGVYEAMQKALNGISSHLPDCFFQIPHLEKSGWTSERAAPLRNKEGDIIGVLGLISDISARKEAEISLNNLNEQLEQRILARTCELQKKEQFLRTIYDGISRVTT